MSRRGGSGARELAYGVVTTPLGRFRAVVGARGVLSLELKPDSVASLRERLEGALGHEFVLRRDDRLPFLRELAEYARGERRKFETQVDFSLARGFRRKVLEALQRVRYGDTLSYGELAARVGRPGAARAVGGAMATNPVALVVPCHRVLASGGRLGGYGGGLALKRRLLALESSLK